MERNTITKLGLRNWEEVNEQSIHMAKNKTINVKGSEITIFVQNETDYISLTDMTGSFKEGSGLIGKWITNKNTLEYLGT